MDLPITFIQRTRPLLGEEWEDFKKSLEEPSPVSIRLNSKKIDVNTCIEEGVAWCSKGFYLPKRPQFTFDPLLHAGCYYVQEASSMFISQILKQYIGNEAVKVLDLCAAPGGKSTLIADAISNESLLVSNEVIRSRANILSENLAKWGFPNVVVTNNDPADFAKLEGFFDVVLVDAPCSGEGMFRKDAGAINEWSEANVKLCKERQQRILRDVWPSLKAGGLIIYSTCTYNLDENEQNVQWISEELDAEALPVDIEPDWGVNPSLMNGIPAYRFFPHKIKGEGFFCAVLRKTGEDNPKTRKFKPAKEKPSKTTLSAEARDYIKDKENHIYYQNKDSWYAFNKSLYPDVQYLKSALHIISEGVCLGEYKGKDFIPNQSLAMSQLLDKGAFPICELSWEQAISYLRKEALMLDNQPKGYILLTYKDMPLGFVKNIGNRANNLYPQEWRIRSADIPREEVRVI
ncbi:rRNA cytosine-C5-methyltransferase [Dysgonomonas sp. 511]|uniref:methyltransferase RsmF C-terminal domain-like protein n=1 Tax=Dysgonomonas sp. 511 TaxID=2302930 RepID=UPI0013D27EE6|nr:rRNA cytosine-C5-methyltransferase [Dysgonomonas sp. 511]NDV78790.1 rRNA cytosine-C5-methyltransferase [Dysgonomonas sp. 511]